MNDRIPSHTLDSGRATLEARADHASPAKLAHIVCLTGQLQAMRRWYMTVLNATVAVENEQLCFLRYDDEHHRIGLVQHPEAAPRDAAPAAGVHHTAFTFADLSQLLGTYLRLQRHGIEPFWCVNHGPTTSMYYRDPDGNRVELQVDNFDTAACDAFFASGAYDENPIGVTFDPDDWVRRHLEGEPDDRLTVRPKLPAGVSPVEQIRN